MKQVTIEYSNHGLAFSDFGLELIFDTILQQEDPINIAVSTENIVHYARLIHMKKIIDLTIVFNGEFISVDKGGCLDHYPIGCADRMDRTLDEILSIKYPEFGKIKV